MEISGLEDEYQLSAGKPRLIYTKKTAGREPRLGDFLKLIQTEGVVSYRQFEDADELSTLIADDLALLLTERFAGPPSAPPAAAPLPVVRRPLAGRAEELGAARLAAARAAGDPAAFDRGLAEGVGWDIDSAIAAGLASTDTEPE